MTSNLLRPGYLRWDGTKYVLDSSVNLQGPPGPPGPQGPGGSSSGPASGDLTGNYPNPTVNKLQNTQLSIIGPTDAQTLSWVASSNSWVPVSQQVATIAALRLTNPTTASAVINLQGYSAAGDGGGGIFYWNSSSVSADNGGTIIAVTGISTGRWIRQYETLVNVKWFGAKGDNSTNDTSSVSATIAVAGTSGTVFFPAGTYILTSVTFTTTVKFDEGAIINPSGTTTFNKSIITSSIQQIFSTGNTHIVLASGINMAYLSWWGIDTTGVSDSSASLNAGIAATISSSHLITLVFPSGIIAIASTIKVNPVPYGNIAWQGAGNAAVGQPTTTIKWIGTAGGDMFIFAGFQNDGSSLAALNAGKIQGINFNGNSLARSCSWLKPSITGGLIFDGCGYFDPRPVQIWKPTTHYNIGDQVITPGTTIGSGAITPPDNAHQYICTVAGISGGTVPAFTSTTGGTFVDGYATWQENGPSPSCVLVGVNDPIDGNSQLDTVRWINCQLFGNATYDSSTPFPLVTGGASGWKTLDTGNNKNYSLDQCYVTNCLNGVDWRMSSGFLNIRAMFCGGNGCDLLQGLEGRMTVNSFESEESNLLYAQGTGGLQGNCNLQGIEWFGRTAGTGGANSPCIISGSKLTLDACYFFDQNPNQKIATAIVDRNNDTVTFNGSWNSRNCRFVAQSTYTDAIELPIYDGGGNRQLPGCADSDYTGPTFSREFISSENDEILVQTAGNFTATLPIPQHLNADTRAGQLHTGFFTAPGMVIITSGTIIGSALKVTIPFTAVKTAATNNTLNIAISNNKNRIRSAYIDITTAFAGLADGYMSLGHASSVLSPGTNSSATSIMYAQNIMATGMFATDPSLIVWGPTGNADPSKEWYITATFTSVTNLNSLNAGSIDIYIQFEQLPFFGGGTTASTTIVKSDIIANRLELNSVVINNSIYNVLNTDTTIICNRANTQQIILPTPVLGRTVTIKDGTGTAATHNITVSQNASETIDGSTSYLITTNFGQVTVVCGDGTNWYIISKF